VSCAALVAFKLESFVADAAVRLLTDLDLTGTPTSVVLSQEEQDAITADERELAELKDMWHAREISTREYREMRKTVDERITRIRSKTVVCPTVEIWTGWSGPNAQASWDALIAEDRERANAVLRFLFAAVIIDKHHSAPGKFDYSRIEIEPNPL
jgi:site-specific DNA recombinase